MTVPSKTAPAAEPLAGRPGLLGPLLLEQGPAGEHHVAVVGLLDAELKLLAHQRGGVADEADVDLRHGAEGARPVHLDLDAALVDGLDDALDRQAGLGRLDHRARAVGVDRWPCRG